MPKLKFVYIAIISFTFKCLSDGIHSENYFLVNNFRMAPLSLSLNNSDNSTPQLNTSSQLQPALSAGKALGTIGTICWVTGNVFEIIGITKLIQDGSGSGLLLTGFALDQFSPIISCIGETMVMNSIGSSGVTLNDSYFEVKPKGWRFYGRSFLFLGIGAIAGIIAASANNTVIGVVAVIAGGASDVYRGIAAIAPLVRVNKAGIQLNIQARPIINKDGNLGLALNCNF